MTFVKEESDFKMYTCSGNATEMFAEYQYKHCREVEACRYCNIQHLFKRTHKFIDPVTLTAGTFIMLGEI